jgi:hypothetical protein
MTGMMHEMLFSMTQKKSSKTEAWALSCSRNVVLFHLDREARLREFWRPLVKSCAAALPHKHSAPHKVK